MNSSLSLSLSIYIYIYIYIGFFYEVFLKFTLKVLKNDFNHRSAFNFIVVLIPNTVEETT